MATRVNGAARRRVRTWLALGVVVVIGAGLIAITAFKGTDHASNPSTQTASLPARTVNAGAVTVKIEPRQLNTDGAVMEVTFDTHSVALGLDEVPDDETFFQRQCLQDGGHIRRVKLLQLLLQFGEILFVDEGLDQLVPAHVLFVNELLDDTMLGKQRENLLQALLYAFLVLRFVGVRHGGGRSSEI